VYSVQEDPVCVSVAYPFTSRKPVQEDPTRVSVAYSVQDDPHSRNPLKKTQSRSVQDDPDPRRPTPRISPVRVITSRGHSSRIRFTMTQSRIRSRRPSRVSVQDDPVRLDPVGRPSSRRAGLPLFFIRSHLVSHH